MEQLLTYEIIVFLRFPQTQSLHILILYLYDCEVLCQNSITVKQDQMSEVDLWFAITIIVAIHFYCGEHGKYAGLGQRTVLFIPL